MSLLLMAGCSNSAPVTQVRLAVWSDDGTEYAFVRESWIHHGGSSDWGSGDYDTDKHAEIILRNADGTHERVLQANASLSVTDMFLMASAGYLLWCDADGSSGYRCSRQDLETGAITVLDPKQPVTWNTFYTVVPSPDGKVLASVTSDPSVSVVFFDASTLGEIARFGPFPTADGAEAFTFYSAWTWAPRGEFYFAPQNEVFEIDAARVLHRGLAAPQCWSPKTTSSDTSRDGRTFVLPSSDVLIEAKGSATFGCQ